MHIAIGFIVAMCLFASFHTVKQNPEGQIQLDIGGQQSVPIELNLIPLSEFQNRYITKQTHDYSCGSAALCTVLNYYLGENFSENQIIHGMLDSSDKAKIMERRAFSLLDMKRFVNKLGYRAVGYKAEIKDLYELKMPFILPIEFLGYRHFTVFRGIHDNHVFLADPFRGNTSYSLSTFKKMWYENVIFVVYPEGATELPLLKLGTADLRYIDEDSIEELIRNYGPTIEFPGRHERDFFNTLPDEYQIYMSD